MLAHFTLALPSTLRVEWPLSVSHVSMSPSGTFLKPGAPFPLFSPTCYTLHILGSVLPAQPQLYRPDHAYHGSVLSSSTHPSILLGNIFQEKEI
jgi:hypothetical protein